MAIFEMSEKKTKNGRRPFTASLYELQPPDSVVDDVGTKFNKNGITFLEEYAKKQLDSIKDMSLRVEFLDDERTSILGHGLTGSTEDGLPLFDNATTIGHFTEGFIKDIEINGEMKKCVCGKGFIDEMAYHPFVEYLETEIENGSSVNGSIEIYRTNENNAIVYKKGWLPEGRIPVEYMHSGWDMVINPADESSALLELNNQSKEEKFTMTEKEIMDTVQKAISEMNTAKSDADAIVSAKDAEIAEKDAKIAELNSTVTELNEKIEAAKADADAKVAELNSAKDELEKLKTEARKTELNEAIKDFSDEEKKYAEVEINAFNEKPMDGDVNAIVSKIYAGIGEASKKAADEAKIAEQNSANDSDVEDIFSEINSSVDDDDDVNIF